MRTYCATGDGVRVFTDVEVGSILIINPALGVPEGRLKNCFTHAVGIWSAFRDNAKINFRCSSLELGT